MPIMSNRAIGSRERVKPIEDAGVAKAVLKRAQCLEDRDRLIVELALKQRLTHRQIGEVFQMPVGTVTRRLQRMSARLYDPLVIDLVDEACPLSSETRQIGVEYFLRKQTINAIATKHQMSLNRVREMIHFVRGWHRGLRTQRDWHNAVRV